MSATEPRSARKLVRIEVDRDLCVGAGICAGTHPHLFRVLPEGHAAFIGASLDGASEAAATEAAELCPVSAISLIYED